MDGYEATRRIKADPALGSITIIAVTSYALAAMSGMALPGRPTHAPGRQLLGEVRPRQPVAGAATKSASIDVLVMEFRDSSGMETALESA